MEKLIRENPEAMKYALDVIAESLKLLDYMKTKSDMNIIHFCAWEGIPNRLSVWEDYHAPVISWSRYIDIYEIDRMRDWTGGLTLWGGLSDYSPQSRPWHLYHLCFGSGQRLPRLRARIST